MNYQWVTKEKDIFLDLEEVELCNTDGGTEKNLRSSVSVNIYLPFIVLHG